jgi:transglutaminase-like putative cysteine protease
MLAQLINYPHEGNRFTDFTLQKMSEFVQSGQRDPKIVKNARTIVASCPPKDYHCEAETIFRWVRENIHYVRDPQNTEWVQAPDVTLREGYADCDDFAVLIDALAGAIGMQSGFEAVRADPLNKNEYSHVYAILRTNKGWHAADPTVAGSFLGWRPVKGIFGRKILLNQ